MGGEGRSLAEIPTCLVETVVSVLVALGCFFHASPKRVGKTQREKLGFRIKKENGDLLCYLKHQVYFNPCSK